MEFQATILNLRQRGAKPRVHPNGFIQLDLSPNQRFHVWPLEELPRPEITSDLHDHVYGFSSKILLGSLHNIAYEIVEDETGDLRMVYVPPYLVHGKTCPVQALDTKRYRSRISNVAILPQKSEYRFEAQQFHRTLAEGLTVSLMTTDPYDPTLLARVMCRATDPDPVFSREKVDPAILWKILETIPDLNF